jgi:hypothetical protein
MGWTTTSSQIICTFTDDGLGNCRDHSPTPKKHYDENQEQQKLFHIPRLYLKYRI